MDPKSGLTLGSERENTTYRPPRKPWTEERPWLPWGVITLAVLVVGGMIVRMMSGLVLTEEA